MFFLHPVNVWIIGDSYVRRGAERAAETMADNLGHDNLLMQWFGWGGLRWTSLLPFFHQSLQGRAVPDVLLIHCSGNDLGSIKNLGLIAAMKEDLRHLHLQYPDSPLNSPRGLVPNLQSWTRFVNSVMATICSLFKWHFCSSPSHQV